MKEVGTTLPIIVTVGADNNIIITVSVLINTYYAAAKDIITFRFYFKDNVGVRIDKDIELTLKIGMTPVLKTAYTNIGKTPPDGNSKINQISELSELIKKINNALVSN
jgi:hypothetical protein